MVRIVANVSTAAATLGGSRRFTLVRAARLRPGQPLASLGPPGLASRSGARVGHGESARAATPPPLYRLEQPEGDGGCCGRRRDGPAVLSLFCPGRGGPGGSAVTRLRPRTRRTTASAAGPGTAAAGGGPGQGPGQSLVDRVVRKPQGDQPVQADGGQVATVALCSAACSQSNRPTISRGASRRADAAARRYGDIDRAPAPRSVTGRMAQ